MPSKNFIAQWRHPAALIGELLIALIASGLLFLWADRFVPPQDLPWKPLVIDRPPGLFTRVKLNLTGGQACRTLLTQSGIAAVDLPERGEGFCRQIDTVRATPTRLSPAQPVMVCREAAAYAIWERQIVAPAARRAFGSPLARVEHYGTYACRRQYGAEQGRVSEHASANAIDIAGFVLTDGRRITVASDWRDTGPKGRFLHEVRDGACRIFDVTLSPDYNAAHYDHLHLDMGRFRTCR